MSGISRNDWLVAIEEAEKGQLPAEDPSVLTAVDLADLLGLCESATRRRIRHLVEANKAEITSKLIRLSDGRLKRVTAYRLLT